MDWFLRTVNRVILVGKALVSTWCQYLQTFSVEIINADGINGFAICLEYVRRAAWVGLIRFAIAWW